jgi:DNA uptake protein ComE-like DNA-binding protein
MRNLFIALPILGTLAMAGTKSLSTVNVNTAPPDSLSAHLPGVGPAIAERIVSNRPYSKCEDLTATVSGIGAKKIARICPLLTF